MHLEGHHEDGGWLLSTFTLTNRVSWEMMLQAIYAAFEYFADITIFVDDHSIKLESREDVLSIPEARNIGIGGESVVVKEPMIIIFYNQVHFINLRIRCGNDDLRDLDYEGFNKIVCPIVDAIELAMYQEPVPAPVKEDATEETKDGEEEKASDAEKASEDAGENPTSTSTDSAEQTENTGNGEQVEDSGDSEPEDETAESAQEDKAAEASTAEPPIPPPPAAEPQDSATPSTIPTPGAEPPIPLPPSEASAPPIPAPAPRKRSEFRCN